MNILFDFSWGSICALWKTSWQNILDLLFCCSSVPFLSLYLCSHCTLQLPKHQIMALLLGLARCFFPSQPPSLAPAFGINANIGCPVIGFLYVSSSSLAISSGVSLLSCQLVLLQLQSYFFFPFLFCFRHHCYQLAFSLQSNEFLAFFLNASPWGLVVLTVPSM